MPTPITWGSAAVQASTVSSSTQKTIGPAEAGVKASRVLTFAGTGADGNTFTVAGPSGAITYTLRTAVTNSIPYEVEIGGDATGTATNAKNAILGTGSGFSTSTPTNPDITAANTAGALTATATFGGTAGNSIATAKNGADLSWAGATFTGGANPAITIPPGATSFTVHNPSAKSFVGSIATPPTELIYVSPDSSDVDSGFLVTGITPCTIPFPANYPPTWYVNTPETGAIPFSVTFAQQAA